MVKVVTINILFEMEKWAQRRELLVEGLAAQQADLIGLQEVKLPEDNSAWLAQQLNIPYVQLVPYKGLDNIGFPFYGGAILTEPAPNDLTVYPSDHFGIAAELEIVR